MRNLKANTEMKPLQDAGIGRQLADWIIGINLTSVATLRYGGSTKREEDFKYRKGVTSNSKNNI